MTVWGALFAACILLQLADGATTAAVLSRGGKELNPVMRWLMRVAGPVPALVSAKAAFILLLWYAADEVSLAVVAGIYALVVVSNVKVLRRM